MTERNSTSADKCPTSLLEDMDLVLLNKWLSVYVAETRKVNKETYPPATLLHSLLPGLQRRMVIKQKHQIFSESDPSFQTLHLYTENYELVVFECKNMLQRPLQRKERIPYRRVVYLVLIIQLLYYMLFL